MASPQTRKRTSRLDDQRDAVVESAKRQVKEVGLVAQDAVFSGAWAYPILVIDLHYKNTGHGQVVKSDDRLVPFIQYRPVTDKIFIHIGYLLSPLSYGIPFGNDFEN